MFTVEKFEILTKDSDKSEEPISINDMTAYISILRYSVIKTFGFQLFEWTTREAVKVLMIARIMSIYEEDKNKSQDMKNSQSFGRTKGVHGLPIQMPIIR